MNLNVHVSPILLTVQLLTRSLKEQTLTGYICTCNISSISNIITYNYY